MVAASGDTSGQIAPPVVYVSCLAPDPPSTSTSYKLNGPSRSLAATTARPSGRQAGVVQRAFGSAASARTARVATSTMATSDGAPGTCRSTAMERPSGDQRGALNWISG